MKSSINKIIILIAVVAIISSCRKSSNISPIPSIEFGSLTLNNDGKKDTASVLVFSYVDGDGDLGRLEGSLPISYNLKIATYEKQNGVFIYLINQDGYIPSLTPKGHDKSISGDITDLLQLPLFKTKDTIRYEVYVIDRAGNSSNKIITPEIVVTTQ